MAKKFEEVKKELDAELETIYNRDENKKKWEKIDNLEAVRNEITVKEKAYDKAVRDEDFDTAVDIQTEIEHLKKKEKIMNKLVGELINDIPDYPHEDIVRIAQKIVSFSNDSRLELLKLYHQKLSEVEKVYGNIERDTIDFYNYLERIKNKSRYPISEIVVSSSIGISSVDEYIKEVERWIRKG